MRMTQKGQVTVPVAIRNRMGILPNSEVEFVIEDKKVVLRKVKGKATRGERIVAALSGRGRRRMTTDEIMSLTRGE